MDGWKKWRQRSQRRFYLKCTVSCGVVCCLLVFLTLAKLISGEPISRKAAAYGPVLLILFAGLGVLNFYRWKYGGEDR